MQRVGLLAAELADRLGFDATKKADLARAADIYKFDLMTGMVGEFDELQGIMGEHYAQLFGENTAVATAVREHYMPTSAAGEVAQSDIGAVLAIADKLDTLVTFFAADLVPSGSNDPYGLRRAATGIVRTLQAKQWRIALAPLLESFIAKTGEVSSHADTAAIRAFILDRVRKLALDAGTRQDFVAAGTANVVNLDVVYVAQRVQTLAQHADDANFRDVIASLTRVSRLAVKYDTDATVDPALFENEAEVALYAATQSLDLHTLVMAGSEAVYEALANLQAPIAAYFDETMVNVDDEAVKNNRYAQLHLINRLISGLGDLEKIVIK